MCFPICIRAPQRRESAMISLNIQPSKLWTGYLNTLINAPVFNTWSFSREIAPNFILSLMIYANKNALEDFEKRVHIKEQLYRFEEWSYQSIQIVQVETYLISLNLDIIVCRKNLIRILRFTYVNMVCYREISILARSGLWRFILLSWRRVIRARSVITIIPYNFDPELSSLSCLITLQSYNCNLNLHQIVAIRPYIKIEPRKSLITRLDSNLFSLDGN